MSDLVRALPRRGRDLRLDQARLRRGARLPVRLVLLGQQHPVLPQPADVHRGGGDLRDRARRHRAGGATGRYVLPATLGGALAGGGAQHRRRYAPGAGCRTSARWGPTSRASCSSALGVYACVTRPSATPMTPPALHAEPRRAVRAQPLGLDRVRLRRAGAVRGAGRRGEGPAAHPAALDPTSRRRSSPSSTSRARSSVLWLVPSRRGEHRLRFPAGARGGRRATSAVALAWLAAGSRRRCT